MPLQGEVSSDGAGTGSRSVGFQREVSSDGAGTNSRSVGRLPTTLTDATVRFQVSHYDDDLDLANSREVAYVKGMTGANLTAKGTFAEVYAKGTTKFTSGKTKGGTVMMKFEGEDLDDEDFEANVSLQGAIMIFALDIIGPGLVGVAFVASNAGIIPFFLFMFLSAVIMVWALDLLQAAGQLAGIKNYEAVGVLSIGKKGLWITTLAISLECYGALIGYLVLIQDTAPAITTAFGWQFDVMWIQIVVTLCAIFPLTCFKDLNALEWTTWYSSGVFIVVMFANIGSAFFDDWYTEEGIGFTKGIKVDFDPEPYQHNRWFFDGATNETFIRACRETGVKALADDARSLFSNVPTLIFAMSCVPSALPVFNELQDGKLETIKKANRISLYGSASLYCFTAVCGYYAAKSNLLSNNLLNMRHCICYDFAGSDCGGSCSSHVCADDNLVGTIINGAFGFAVVAGYSTMHYVLRRSIVTVIWGETAPFDWTAHIGIAVINVAATLLVAIIAGDVEVVFNWAGALGVPLVGFVLPGMYFSIQLKHRRKMADDPTLTRAKANVLMVMGVVCMVGGVALEISDMLS